MSLFPCGIIHQVPVLDPERYSNESQERQEIYICVTALLILLIRELMEVQRC